MHDVALTRMFACWCVVRGACSQSYDHLDEVTSAFSVKFSADGRQILVRDVFSPPLFVHVALLSKLVALLAGLALTFAPMCSLSVY